MVRAVRSHQEEDNEDFISRTSNAASNNEGRSGDPKANVLIGLSIPKQSSEGEARLMKGKLHFKILRELIPENDQKKDKATFLLERNNAGAVESFVDQSQLIRSGPESTVAAPTILTNTQNSINSDFSYEATFRATDHGAATQATPLSMPMEANMFEGGIVDPQGAFSDTEHFTSQSQPRVWDARPCTTECATTGYTTDEQQEQKIENMGVSDACSQGLLNTLSHALESSGVDLSQMSISVQLDIAKRGDSGTTSMVFCTKDYKNLSPSNQVLSRYEVESSGEDSDRAHKRLRTEQG